MRYLQEEDEGQRTEAQTCVSPADLRQMGEKVEPGWDELAGWTFDAEEVVYLDTGNGGRCSDGESGYDGNRYKAHQYAEIEKAQGADDAAHQEGVKGSKIRALKGVRLHHKGHNGGGCYRRKHISRVATPGEEENSPMVMSLQVPKTM